MAPSRFMVDNGKVRLETTSGILITRPDTHKIYQIMVDQRTVIQRSFNGQGMGVCVIGANAKYEVVGSDVIGGIACTKYKVAANGDFLLLWVDAAKQVPVKMITPDNDSTLDYKSYQPGTQDASLFDPPTDYKWIYSD